MHYFSDDMYKSTKFAFGFCRLNGNISELTYILYNLGHNRDQGGHDLMHFDIYVHVPISMQPLSGEDYSWATNPQNSTISHSTGSQVAKQQEETLSEGDFISFCIELQFHNVLYNPEKLYLEAETSFCLNVSTPQQWGASNVYLLVLSS